MKQLKPFFRCAAGFTLVEMIIVIVITGIVAGMVAVFIRSPIQAYQDAVSRARLTGIADGSLRRITRDVRAALPNSIQTPNATSLVYIPTTGGGRYRQYPASVGGGPALMSDTASNSFAVLGPVPSYGAGDEVVIYNEPDAGRDAYLGNNRQPLAAPYPAANQFSSDGAPFTITLAGPQTFVPGSPWARFHIVQPPVIYRCTPNAANPAAGVLTRHEVNFNQASAFILNPATAIPAGNVLADGVAACTFTYVGNVGSERTGIVSLWLTLGSASGGGIETVSLMMQTQVSNHP